MMDLYSADCIIKVDVRWRNKGMDTCVDVVRLNGECGMGHKK